MRTLERTAKPETSTKETWAARMPSGREARQHSVEPGAHNVPGSIHEVLRTSGEPLDAGVRGFLELRFSHDFSSVRVHSDSAAARSTSDLGARAWTFGNHIAFGEGMYSPFTPRGGGLLAHELTHVVQQRGTSAASQPRLGQAGDRFEREADSHASLLARGQSVPGAAQLSSPVVQRSLLSGFLDVVLFIPRLFGLSVFPAEQLREYLDELRQRRGPSRSLFSDNKARACVAREQELGPYDAQTKIWLVQDMLDGWTSWLDEGAIINLLRRSAADRQQIVAGVGRDLLWSKFSGRNRRIIEALTLTAADAGDPLVSRLRNLSPDELRDYSGNTTDPAVQDAVRRALALTNITAPVPVGAAINQAGQAAITINGIQITVRPDQITPSLGRHAFTHSNFQFLPYNPIQITPDNANQPVGPIPPSVVTLAIWTEYPSESSKSGSSGYGAGPTLREHERAHGQGWFDFVRNNPPPVFQGHDGMTATAYNAAAEQYNTAVRDYERRAGEFAQRAGDCIPGRFPTDEQLQGTGFTAAICRNQP